LDKTHELISIAIRTPPLPKLPATVTEVHASYAVTNRADAMLYHDALCNAARSLGIGVATFDRGKEFPPEETPAVERFLAGLRATLGPPWQKDHQTATARAIATLGKKGVQIRMPR
jgi:hypothetical protein